MNDCCGCLHQGMRRHPNQLHRFLPTSSAKGPLRPRRIAAKGRRSSNSPGAVHIMANPSHPATALLRGEERGPASCGVKLQRSGTMNPSVSSTASLRRCSSNLTPRRQRGNPTETASQLPTHPVNAAQRLSRGMSSQRSYSHK